MSGFKNVEHFQYSAILEQVPFLYRLGLITDDLAKAMIEREIDALNCNLLVGRNLNTHASDKLCIPIYEHLKSH